MARRQCSSRNLATRLGWNEPYLSRRLTGKVPFTVGEMAVIADLLDVPVSRFFEVDTGVRTAPIRRSGLGLAA